MMSREEAKGWFEEILTMPNGKERKQAYAWAVVALKDPLRERAHWGLPYSGANGFECSACRGLVELSALDYCPFCGAKMNGLGVEKEIQQTIKGE